MISRGALGRYFAGLWEHNMITQLAWRWLSLLDRVTGETLSYRAPSWSWASVNGPVDHRYVRRPLAQISLAITNPIGDHYGAVTGGYLKVKASFCRAILRRDEARNYTMAKLDVCPSFEKDIICWWSHPCPAATQHYSSDLLHDIAVYIMPLGFEWETEDHLVGLILLPTDESRGQYRRIGLFECSSGGLLNGIKAASYNLGRSLYQEGEDCNGYSIEII